MTRYRLLFIEDFQLQLAVPFEADDDDTALRYVDRRRFGRPCELWTGDRLVERFADRRERRVRVAIAKVGS